MEITERRRLKELAANKEMEIAEQRRLKELAAKREMEIAAQSRLKEEVAEKQDESKAKVPENRPVPVIEDLKMLPLLPAIATPRITEEVKTFISQVNHRPSQEIIDEPKVVAEGPKEVVEEVKEVAEEPKEVVEEPKEVAEEIKEAAEEPKELPFSNIWEDNVEVIKNSDPVPASAVMSPVVLILSLFAFLIIVSSIFSETWVDAVVTKLNALIIYGSFVALSIIQEPYTAVGTVLNTHDYKVSLQGDLVVLYSLELLIILSALLAFFKKTTWINSGVVFMTMVPIVIIINIFRVVVACGLALNYGIPFADMCFHSDLVGFVFLFVVLGLISVEFLFSSD